MSRGKTEKSLEMFDSILGGKSISSFKDSASLIAAIADGYQKLGSAEQKAFVSQELFGRSGLKMSELLSQGDEGIKKLIADFESHGGGFSEDGAKNAEAFNDELQNMMETVNSLKISVAQELFPTFIDLFNLIGALYEPRKNPSSGLIRYEKPGQAFTDSFATKESIFLEITLYTFRHHLSLLHLLNR